VGHGWSPEVHLLVIKIWLTGILPGWCVGVLCAMATVWILHLHGFLIGEALGVAFSLVGMYFGGVGAIALEFSGRFDPLQHIKEVLGR
jgi:hypothetical protein